MLSAFLNRGGAGLLVFEPPWVPTQAQIQIKVPVQISSKDIEHRWRCLGSVSVSVQEMSMFGDKNLPHPPVPYDNSVFGSTK